MERWHTGQVALQASHLSRHSRWYWCLQQCQLSGHSQERASAAKSAGHQQAQTCMPDSVCNQSVTLAAHDSSKAGHEHTCTCRAGCVCICFITLAADNIRTAASTHAPAGQIAQHSPLAVVLQADGAAAVSASRLLITLRADHDCGDRIDGLIAGTCVRSDLCKTQRRRLLAASPHQLMP